MIDFASLFLEVNKADEQLLIIIKKLIYLRLRHVTLIIRAAILISELFRKIHKNTKIHKDTKEDT